MKKSLTIGVILLFSLNIFGQLPYQNPNLTSEQRANDLISRLSLKEKAGLMCDQSEAIPRLGIKKFNWWSEALHGLAQSHGVTVLPAPIGMAASFNDKLVFKAFNAVSDEFRAKYNESRQKGEENRAFLSLSVWTPNINIFRDPRWGRGQETYGEDPFLTSRMGISVVNGLQGPPDSRYKKLLACAKHFAVHSGPEWSRHALNLNGVSPRDLWETYLPAFKSLVQQADVRQVMCAYQRFDDEPCCGSTRFLQRILRDDWGYKYLVVSDCGAIADFYSSHKVSSDDTHAAAKAVLAGTDVECGFGYAYKKLPEAIEKGMLSEADLDQRLKRVLVGRLDLGEMDTDSLVSWSKIPMSVVNSSAHQSLALQVAQESMTLLQNKGNVLPLSKSMKKVAVIGPNADEKSMPLGNYNGYPANTITILDGIKSKLSEDKIFYEKGCDLTDDMITECVFGECSYNGKPGLGVTYWNNKEFKGDAVTSEQITSPIQLTTAGQHQFSTGVNLKGFTAKYQTVYNATKSEELVFSLEYAGNVKLVVNGDTIVNGDVYYSAPSKRLFKVEKGKEYKIELLFTEMFQWVDASLKFNFGREFPVDYEGVVSKLKDIDEVVFVGGLSSKLEGEEMAVQIPGFKGGDRTDIELPASQRKYLQALKKAGKKVVFVNCSGSAIALVPETESCDAILQAWYGGQSGGQAVADVLFGDYNPAGKLPITFYKSSAQLKDFEDYSMKGRTYRFMNDALFPFGHGLSYTTFNIGKAKPNKEVIRIGESVKLNIPVTNTGKRDGVEVVQIYIRKMNDKGGPLKTLRGFERVQVAAGKTQHAVIELDPSSFEFFNADQQKMAVSAGEYEVFYGNTSEAKYLKKLKIKMN